MKRTNFLSVLFGAFTHSSNYISPSVFKLKIILNILIVFVAMCFSACKEEITTECDIELLYVQAEYRYDGIGWEHIKDKAIILSDSEDNSEMLFKSTGIDKVAVKESSAECEVELMDALEFDPQGFITSTPVKFGICGSPYYCQRVSIKMKGPGTAVIVLSSNKRRYPREVVIKK